MVDALISKALLGFRVHWWVRHGGGEHEAYMDSQVLRTCDQKVMASELPGVGFWSLGL